MKIGSFDTDKEVLVIAEVGNNHEGNYALAQEMIGLAAEAGAGAVKFQTIVPEKLVSVLEKDRIQQLKKFQLSYEQFAGLKKQADQAKILFLSTPFDIESAQFLNSLVPAFKIASGDNDFFPMIEVIAKTLKPIILSSGLTDLKQIEKSKLFIERIWKECHFDQKPLVILHCVASYPVPPAEVNLRALTQLRTLGVEVGFSDHTIGIESAMLAVALGAQVIEKHFTIDKNYSDFRDHKLSVDPKELKELVSKIKETRERLGSGEKKVQLSEQESLKKARRSIVASHDLEAGKVLESGDLTWVRPGNGLEPGREHELFGKTLTKTIKSGELILLSDLK